MRLFLAFLVLVSVNTCRAEIINIDNAQLASLSSSGVPVIDIRTAAEWEESGIVPGSHLLTFFDEHGNADPESWLRKAGKIARPADPVIVICRSGNRTRTVSKFLSQEAGYKKVYNVTNGMRGWVAEGRPVAPAAPALAACLKGGTC